MGEIKSIENKWRNKLHQLEIESQNNKQKHL